MEWETLDFIPRVEKFFGRLELPVGSLIIGIVQLFLPSFFPAYHIYGHNCEKKLNKYGAQQYVHCPPEWAHYTWIVLYIVNVVSPVFIIFIYFKNKFKGLLFLAVFIQMTLVIIYLLMMGVVVVILVFDEDYVDCGITFTASLIVLALTCYFVMVLYSWYKSM